MRAKKSKQKTVLLIDGDVLVYQIGLAAERPIDWGDGLWTLHADFNECVIALNARVNRWKFEMGAEEVKFALSCPTSEGFRVKLCPTYKSNRKAVRKPIVHQPIREYLLNEYNAILAPQLEADDVLGILATRPTDERRIIVSVDKDYRGVPCSLYRTCEEKPRVEVITEGEARRFHALQTLTGDRTDGYVGIDGCGPAKASKIIEGVPTEELWPTILKAYEKAGLSEEVALTTARLARILQHGDYDNETGEVKLWIP